MAKCPECKAELDELRYRESGSWSFEVDDNAPSYDQLWKDGWFECPKCDKILFFGEEAEADAINFLNG